MKSRRAPKQQPAQTDGPGSLAHITAKIGLQDADEEEYFIWPEHEKAWGLFLRFITQARYAGMSGVLVGLDYTPIQLWLQDQVEDPAQRNELLQQIQWCELGLLEGTSEMAEMSK